jgi:hypothetical protein
MSEDFITHLNASRFMAQRAVVAETAEVTPPKLVALPGALTPISTDRLEAHQDDGLTMHEIVDYENEHFLKTNVRVRERHAQWVNRDYNAMVQAHREIEADRRRKEAEASAAYQRRVAEILANRKA